MGLFKGSEYVSHTTPRVRDYNCPKCGKWHNDSDEGYVIDNVKYPIITNESKGSTLDGNYWDWEEEHKCEECGTVFWFKNGAY